MHDFDVLCMNVKKSLIILTSRTADFNGLPVAAHKYEISTLSQKQVKRFIEKYFRNKEISERVYDELVGKKLLGAEFIPLTLTYMCIVYRKYGKFFNSRRELYNRIIDLMIDEWDIRRKIRRDSNFEKFDTFDKKRFLRQLAYNLTTETWTYYFPIETVKSHFARIVGDFDGISRKDFYSVFQEIEVHTGFFVKSGEGYIFSHRTIQEYLTATYLYEFPEIPRDDNLLLKMPNELALATSFNENASLYISYIILNRFGLSECPELWTTEFWHILFDRMKLERPNFKIHPYLGLSALFLFSRFVSTGMNRRLIQMNEELVSLFFAFINSDGKIEKSLSMLSEAYKISSDIPEKGIIELSKKTEFDGFRIDREIIIDKKLHYNEPSRVLCPYKYISYFNSNT